MPLKGYHLKKLYPSTDMRYASDCDVLIDVAQLKTVRALVDELGLATKRHDEHHDIVYYPVLKKHIWLLPIFYFVRWAHVLFTRPKNIGKLKKIGNVEADELQYMKELRGGLGIEGL